MRSRRNHRIPKIDRFVDLEHTSVLKLTFNFLDAIPKSEISDNQPYHCESKFHQYDPTFHFHFWKCGKGIDVFNGSLHITLSGLFVVPVISGLNS